MTRCLEKTFCTKRYPYKEPFSKKYKKSTISKKLNTGRRFLKKIQISYEQKKKFDAMRLMKQPISPSTDR